MVFLPQGKEKSDLVSLISRPEIYAYDGSSGVRTWFVFKALVDAYSKNKIGIFASELDMLCGYKLNKANSNNRYANRFKIKYTIAKFLELYYSEYQLRSKYDSNYSQKVYFLIK